MKIEESLFSCLVVPGQGNVANFCVGPVPAGQGGFLNMGFLPIGLHFGFILLNCQMTLEGAYLAQIPWVFIYDIVLIPVGSEDKNLNKNASARLQSGLWVDIFLLFYQVDLNPTIGMVA